MKGLFLVGAPFWLAHNLMVGALFALGTDLVSLASNLAHLMKFLVRRGVSARASTSIASITEPVTILAWSGYLQSEEHTSELQSLMRISYAIFCLKKKKQQTQ